MDENKTKTCISCGLSKPATTEYFYYRNKSRGWFSSWCKESRSEKRKVTISQELLLQRVRRGQKPCVDCGTADLPKGHMYCNSCLSKRKRTKKRYDKSIYKRRLRLAMPKWADKNAIREIYRNRPDGMHVDHIIPLRGENVCGLHVVNNLQYLPKEENMKKSNRFNDGNHYSIPHGGYK